MKSTVFTLAIALAGNVVSSSAAYAQFHDSLSGSWNNPMSATLATMLNDQAMASAARTYKYKGTPASGTVAPASKTTAAPVTFHPVAKNLMVKELADALVSGTSARRELTRAFEEYLRNFSEQASKDNEPANDLGRAAAYFVMVNYAAATGRTPTSAQADGAQAILRAGLAASTKLAATNDRERQRLYESLVILGSFPLAVVKQAKQQKDVALEKRGRGYANDLIKTLLGVPVTKINLTANGFTIVK